jgi:outer membrane protein assembly factor BamB
MPRPKARHIEHIGLPRDGENLFATGEATKRVTVWSILTRERISQFSTILDFGGPRLALVCENHPTVVTGSWTRGVSAYDGVSGQELWSRRDLKNVQLVRDLSDNDAALIGVGLEDRPYYILRADNGENYAQFASTTKLYVSSFAPLCFLVGRKTVSLTTRQSAVIWKKPMISFAVLDVAFSSHHVVYSESAGSVYCFDFYGTELWRFEPEENHHVLRIAWDQELQRWLGVYWNTHGGPKRLLEMGNNPRVLYEIGDTWLTQFSPSGKHLITSNGEVISTQSGRCIWKFNGDTNPGKSGKQERSTGI